MVHEPEEIPRDADDVSVGLAVVPREVVLYQGDERHNAVNYTMRRTLPTRVERVSVADRFPAFDISIKDLVPETQIDGFEVFEGRLVLAQVF